MIIDDRPAAAAVKVPGRIIGRYPAAAQPPAPRTEAELRQLLRMLRGAGARPWRISHSVLQVTDDPATQAP